MCIVNHKSQQQKKNTCTGHKEYENGHSAKFLIVNEKGELRHVVINKNKMVAHCSCDWGVRHMKAASCKHSLRAWELFFGKRVYAWGSEDEAKRQHKPMVNIGDGTWITVG